MSLFGGSESSSTQTTTATRYGSNPAETQGFDLWSALWGPLFEQQGLNLTSTDRIKALEAMGADPAFIEKVKTKIAAGKVTNQLWGTEQAELTPEQQQRKQIEDQIYGKSLDTLNLGIGGGISPEVRAELDKIYQAQDAEAFSNLQRMGRESAGSRGLNLTDTPVFRPMMDAYGDYQVQAGASKARDILGQNAAAMQRAQGLREFQLNLQQQKFGNTFNLSQAAGNMASQLYQTRARHPRQTKTTTTSSSSGGSPLGAIAGGLGGLGSMFMPSIAPMMAGGGTMGALAGGSSAVPGLMQSMPGLSILR